MLRQIGGVVVGVVAWFLIANVGNHVLCMTWPGYSEVARDLAAKVEHVTAASPKPLDKPR
jgi:hypothetical protein